MPVPYRILNSCPISLHIIPQLSIACQVQILNQFSSRTKMNNMYKGVCFMAVLVALIYKETSAIFNPNPKYAAISEVFLHHHNPT